MADTAGRQMGLPLYAVLKGKTMNIMSLLNALPGAVAQGLIWGIMAIGVYITFRILDFADLTGRRFFVYRRCSLHYDDVKGTECMGVHGGSTFWQVWQQAALPDFYIPLWGFRLSFPVSLHSWDYILLT